MKRNFSILAASCVAVLALPSAAQHASMPNMAVQGGAENPVAKSVPAAEPKDHSAHQSTATTPSQSPAGASSGHAGHDTGATTGMHSNGTSLPAGNAPAPPAPLDHYADRDFPVADMARARDTMMREQGGSMFGQAFINVLEYQAHRGPDGYRWDGEAWYGGDIERLWLKSEGEGEFGGGLDSAEVQALYSRAVGPYFDLQAGLRQDFGRGPGRTYVTAGFEGLAPGFFEVEGAMFLSTTGDVLGRLEGYYDQRLTQRLILQPRAEVNLSAQDIPANAIGAGLVDIELGLRLRYEFSRQFAPYVGVSYFQKFGGTARLSRLAGEDTHATSFVAGVRFWF